MAFLSETARAEEFNRFCCELDCAEYDLVKDECAVFELEDHFGTRHDITEKPTDKYDNCLVWVRCRPYLNALENSAVGFRVLFPKDSRMVECNTVFFHKEASFILHIPEEPFRSGVVFKTDYPSPKAIPDDYQIDSVELSTIDIKQIAQWVRERLEELQQS